MDTVDKKKKAKKHTIMIVSDEKNVRNSMVSWLSNDYNVVITRDGQEVMDTIKKMEKPGDVSLIISDQRLPKLTGSQLFEKLNPVIPNAVRIILTAKEDKKAVIDAVNKAKVFAFMLKPVDPDNLKLTVKRAFEVLDLRQQLEERNKELDEAKKRNKELSLTDPLTGLNNRRYLYETIGRDIATLDREYENLKNNTGAQSLESALIFFLLDLDHFKTVSESIDHMAGDMMLTQVANILRKQCREGSILIRWGGDAFLIAGHFPQRVQASKLAERLIQSVKEELHDPRKLKEPPLGCSIGFAAYPFLPGHPGEPNWEQVVSVADFALHAAKYSGGSAWIGISSTQKTDPPNLSRRVHEDIKTMVANGELEVLTSIPGETGIAWKES